MDRLLRLLRKPPRWLSLRWAERRTRVSPTTFFEHIIALAAAEADLTPLAAPFVSLVVPVYNTNPAYLDALLNSVQQQRAGAWRLIFSDDGSPSLVTQRWLERHSTAPNVLVLRHARNRGIAWTTNAAIAVAETPWVALVDHDDALAPYALDRIERALAAAPRCKFIYTDEVVADARLRPVDFFLKPAFDDVMLSGVNYINHLSLYRRDHLMEIGGLREGLEGSQDYDLVLRYTRGLLPEERLHLPYPAYLWRRDGATYSVRHLERATDSARRALVQAYAAGSERLTVDPAGHGDLHRLRFDLRPRSWPRVSVIIPNRDSPEAIARIVDGLRLGTDYPNFEILVVDNGSTDPRTLSFYEKMRAEPGAFRTMIEDEPFNFARAINNGVRCADGQLILWLSNNIEVLESKWLKEMVSCLDYPGVGIVGAKLVYPNKTLRHAGVIVGYAGAAGHLHLGLPEDYPGSMGRLWVRQSLSAVTGACLLVSRRAMTRIGRLDEERFAIAYNDVDYCMRAMAAGFKVVWTPFACLAHRKSASRGRVEEGRNLPRLQGELANLRALHGTENYEDGTISPWNTRDSAIPNWVLLSRLPQARIEGLQSVSKTVE